MRVAIFDCETTGLIRNRTLKLEKQPEIIEFYGCYADLKTGKVTKEIDLLIKPSRDLSDTPAPGDKKTITQITGLTNEMLKGKPSFKEVSKEIHNFIIKAPLLIAHNASFDKDMVEIEFERLKIELAWPRLICTVEQTVALKGYRLSMSNLYMELFGETFSGAHRAKVDVQALLRCCKELHKRKVL